MARKKTVLGEEYDAVLRRRLLAVLTDMAAIITQSDWFVAGSQEVTIAKALVKGEALYVEAETYIGLSIEGPSDLVDEISRRVGALRA